MKIITRILVALAAIVVSTAALAQTVTNVYFMPCDAGVGTDAGFDIALTATCPSSNSYNGLSRYPGLLDDGVTVNSAYGPKRDLNLFNYGSLPVGGYRLLFARGSYWAHPDGTRILSHSGSSAANYTYIGAYTPPQGCGACADPIIRWPTNATNAGFYFPGGPSYVTAENLDLRGPGFEAVLTGSGYVGRGFEYYNKSTHHIIRNNKIRGFSIAIYNEPLGPTGMQEDVLIEKNLIQKNSGQGYFGGARRLVGQLNTFIQNGFTRQTFDHNVYNAFGDKITWQYNTLLQSNDNGAGCKATSFVAHKSIPNLRIVGNYFEETNAADSCYGIQLNSYPDTTPTSFVSGVIAGNRLINMGNSGISCNSCKGVLIENNALIWTLNRGYTTYGITIPDGGSGNVGDYDDGQAIVRNNYLYMDYANSLSQGIRVNGITSNNGTPISGDTVVSNIVHFGPNSNASAMCYQTGSRAKTTFTAWDYNACYKEGGGTVRWSDQFTTLAAAQAATWDLHSTNVTLGITLPVVGSTTTFRASCSGGCPTGHPTLSSTIGIDSRNLNGARQMGPDVSGPLKIGPAAPTW